MSYWLAIVNPHSGGSRTHARLPHLVEHLRRVADKVMFTKYPGHAAELARGAKAYGGLAVVGGDGTLSEILMGLNLMSQRIAIIPAGRGNSLARDLGLLRPLPNLEVMNYDPLHVDLLEVTFKDIYGVERKNLSASTIALGYPAAVARAARRFKGLGQFCYAAAAVSIHPVSRTVEISYDHGRPTRKYLKGVIANNTRYVANFLAFPHASCCDGYFDFMELTAGYVGQTVHNLSALTGTNFYRPFDLFRAKRTRLRLQEPQELMIDGEFYRDVISMDIRILPGALACNRRDAA
jgi:diacylglycerol kinase family enzyme